MEKLFINLGQNSYYINFQDDFSSWLIECTSTSAPAIVITDSNIDAIYGNELKQLFNNEKLHKYVIPAGEASKNIKIAMEIIEYMLNQGFTRGSRVIAFGGGMVGDISGFIASIYMRGIDLYQVPTTLLSQVDSSVGGKTGINLPQGKNLVGTFYQPKGVLIAPGLLKTLPRSQLTSGLGEVIKYGIIYDYSLMGLIRDNIEEIYTCNPTILAPIINRCCEIKAEVVTEDEREAGLRKILNYGHTIGHGLEALTDYEGYTHGEAVLVGMYHEAAIAKALGLVDDDYFNEISELIKATRVSVDITKFSSKELIDKMSRDKKNIEDKISFILPNGRGRVKEVLLKKEEVLSLIQ